MSEPTRGAYCVWAQLLVVQNRISTNQSGNIKLYKHSVAISRLVSVGYIPCLTFRWLQRRASVIIPSGFVGFILHYIFVWSFAPAIRTGAHSDDMLPYCYITVVTPPTIWMKMKVIFTPKNTDADRIITELLFCLAGTLPALCLSEVRIKYGSRKIFNGRLYYNDNTHISELHNSLL